MSRNNLSDFLLILFLSIALGCLPINLITSNEILIVSFQIVLQIGYFLFIFFYTPKKTMLKMKQSRINIKYTLLLIPVLIICFSNLFYGLFCGESFVVEFNTFTLLRIFLTIFIAINEELLYRLILISNLEKGNKFRKIIVSSLVFSIVHLTIFFSSFNLVDLIVPCYTFFLGIILGATYFLTNSIIPCITIHFLFNLFNSIIFQISIKDFVSYIIISILVGLISFLYLFLVVFFKNKKRKQ